MTNFSWLLYKEKKNISNFIYKLSEGDIIKIGKIILHFREINIKKTNQNFNNNKTNFLDSNQENSPTQKNIYKINISKKNTFKDQNGNKEILNNEINESLNTYLENNDKSIKTNIKLVKTSKISLHKAMKLKKKKKCRICYSDEENPILNPLIQPCSCSGSLRYIHYYCLLHWLSTKISMKKINFSDNNFFYIYPVNRIECEICREKLPEYIKHNNMIYSLINFENYTSNDYNYIIFDVFAIDKINNRLRYIIKFENLKSLILGRGNEANIILNDISISRKHCKININNYGDLILQDLNSKFGTLVLIQNKKMEILNGQMLCIQVGRTFLSFEIKKKFSFFCCCDVDEIENNKSYEKLNKDNNNISKKTNIKIEKDNFNDDDDEEIEEDYNKLKVKQAVFFKIIHDENYNSIDIKENNNIETSTINQGENTNINSIILNFRNNKSTIESEQFGTLNINRPRLIGISENSNEDNKSINDNI